jgi:hypothetical protein
LIGPELPSLSAPSCEATVNIVPSGEKETLVTPNTPGPPIGLLSTPRSANEYKSSTRGAGIGVNVGVSEGKAGVGVSVGRGEGVMAGVSVATGVSTGGIEVKVGMVVGVFVGIGLMVGVLVGVGAGVFVAAGDATVLLALPSDSGVDSDITIFDVESLLLLQPIKKIVLPASSKNRMTAPLLVIVFESAIILICS